LKLHQIKHHTNRGTTTVKSTTIGKLFSKDNEAYGYLSESAAALWRGIKNILRKVGFIDVVAIPQTLGVATIYVASKK
jgi:demethylmenaquinone methyltransferase/2-methoxy-6-polyprenyl-1,4-benzoquinol methylase